MSTVTTRPPSWNRDESQRRVAHPLERLRGYIRFYVSAEGLAVLLLYLGLWFWIGMLLDYGVFKAFALDWVQVLPRGFRVVVLSALVAGLLVVVAVKVLWRLFREFRSPALALVLERRFPRLLGDRLITAVELADADVAERYGYSQAMIDQTIRDAAASVEQVPVGDVFNWKRLRRYGLAVLVVTIGCYVLAGIGYCLVKRTTAVGRFAQQFNDVAAIWLERNILLFDTIWPRRAHLELMNFPGDELRVGRDAPPPSVRVRALQWVIADTNRHKAPEGWRSLLWTDLKPDLLGGELPRVALPSGWDQQSMDFIEYQLGKPEEKNKLTADQVIALDDIFVKLEASAATATMSRRLRKLELPGEVTIKYSGASVSSEQSLQKEKENEYAVTLSDLKESVRFTVRGEDYYTPYKKITVVPPPAIVELARDDARPAYLYHAVPRQAEPGDLRGKKQKFDHLMVSLAGDTSRIDVPAGTDVTLTATTDKTLADKGVRILPPKKGAPAVTVSVEQLNSKTFRTRFANVTAPIDFTYEFVDTDNVVGRRHIIIKPGEDQAPEVDVQVEVLRKVNQGYLCTPMALAPFSGKVHDDWGLASVEFAYTLKQLESQASVNVRATMVASAVSWGFGGLGQRLAATGLVAALKGPSDQEEQTPVKIPLETFLRTFKEKGTSDVSLEDLLPRLEGEPPQKPLLKDHNLDPEVDKFDVNRLGLKVKDENTIQPHYRLRLWMVAKDTNVETGPRSADSKEKFTLLVVSENELLLEIGKEEEGLHVKLEDTVNRLKDAQTKLDNVITELPGLKQNEFSPMARRAEEIEEAIVKAEDVTREVNSDYGRILKELKTNQVKPQIITKVDEKICQPLEVALAGDFGQSEESIRDFKKILDQDKKSDPPAAEKARDRLQKLIARLESVLDNMAEITNFNKLVEILVKIEKGEEEELAKLQLLYKKKTEDLLKQFEKSEDKEK